MRSLPQITVAIVVAVAAACATPSVARTGEPSTRVVREGGLERPAEDVAHDLLLRGTALAGAGDVATATTLLRRVVDEFADTRSRGPATVKLAALLSAEGSVSSKIEARRALERYLLEEPAGDDAPRAREQLAALAAPNGERSAKPSGSVDDVIARLPEGDRGPALVKLGREFISRGDGKKGLVALLTALPLLPPAERKAIEEDIVFALDLGAARGGVALGEVAALRERYGKTDAFADQALTWKLARAALHQHDAATSSRLANELLSTHPKSRFAKDAATLVERLNARVQTDARAIGVILPLSGEYAAYGRRALVALRLAFQMPVAEDKAPEPQLDPATGELAAPRKKDEKPTGTLTTPTGLKLVIKDSAGSADAARRAVRELVENDHVIAVLGDILVDTSLPIALACEDFGVPMLSLSRREGVPEAGPWSFRLALTPKKQAQALVELAVDGLHLKRFGVMYPKKSFSVELMNEFWNALDARQAEITAVESYAHDQTTFTDEARSLVGRGLGGGGREVAECREQAQSIDNDYRRKKALEGCNDKARPIIDFEALFVPDGSRGVSFVVPALVAEDVLLTNQRSAVEAYKKATGNEKVRPVLLLGPSTWNDPDIATRLGRQVDGAVFVDGFDPDDQTKLVQGFVGGFQQATRSRPALVEAQVFDGARLLAALLAGETTNAAEATPPRPTTRAALQKALASVNGYVGVTGSIRFDDVGDSQTPLLFFQIEREKVERVEKEDLVRGAG
jgi:ABC-type branched-subunit amino acid transport system substrate-binding protein